MFEINISNNPSCARTVLYSIRNDVTPILKKPDNRDKMNSQIPQQPTPINAKNEKNADATLTKIFKNLDENLLVLGSLN